MVDKWGTWQTVQGNSYYQMSYDKYKRQGEIPLHLGVYFYV